MDTCKYILYFYICNVFFIVLDLRLTTWGHGGGPFFCHYFTFKTYSDLILFLLFKLSLVYFFLLNLR